MRVLVLSASPRVDGNSRLLADALLDGARGAGHEGELVDLNGTMDGGFLRDCRRCRRPDGRCAIEDGYAALLRGPVARADAIVYATPIYWYGTAAVLKNFFDRMVCHTSGSAPDGERVIAELRDKRSALLLASEEQYPGIALGIVAQLQELSRYLHHQFVGVVHGVGNRRGEVAADPADPLAAARALGARIFEAHHTDYRVDTPRPSSVWSVDGSLGAYADG
ncbi:flavodoxin family protein [Patulibacter defluvii]|uniref:flavodoxin family protein n=1 Tax=Patulibacter defluvii TaxID=3095358 RepID=UPI002A7656C4|nr:flavodoxin family protein [Patulibacter sp. DM4]